MEGLAVDTELRWHDRPGAWPPPAPPASRRCIAAEEERDPTDAGHRYAAAARAARPDAEAKAAAWHDLVGG